MNSLCGTFYVLYITLVAKETVKKLEKVRREFLTKFICQPKLDYIPNNSETTNRNNFIIIIFTYYNFKVTSIMT